MWIESWRRIRALFLRYAYLHKRSILRLFDIFFWPVMDLLIWGFVVLYIRQAAEGRVAQLIVFLLGAIISWDVHYRSQQAVTLSLMEEVWTRNIVNMLIAPMKAWEWVAASFLYGMMKATVITVILSSLAKLLYAFDVTEIGWTFVPLVVSLLIFGWSIGLFTAGFLVRYGYAAEALIWGIPFLIQPFSCVFYPVSALPAWARGPALVLPSTHVFEGLRAVLRGDTVPTTEWATVLSLNLVYLVLGAVFFLVMLRSARAAGELGRLGQH